MADLSKYDNDIQDLGWEGTAEDLFDLIKSGEPSDKLCGWLHTVGEESRTRDDRLNMVKTRAQVWANLENSWKEFELIRPAYAEQLNEDVLRQYGECVVTGYMGEAVPRQGISWVWVLGGGIAAAIGLGYWATRK